RAAGVEAEPAEPEGRRAEHGHRRVVRFDRLEAVAATAAEDERRDERGDATRDVHDRAAREVERAETPQPPAGAPDPVRYRVVHQRRPEEREHDERLEALALRERTGDERGR